MPIRADFLDRYGPWALVTGAAQGMGAVYGERLASLGLSVVLVDIQEDRLERQAERIREASPGVAVRTVVCDLNDPADVQATVDAVGDLEIGLLVANAAIGAVGRWLEVPLETKLQQVAVNCTSVVILADGLTRPMVDRRRGGVIVMASGAANAGSSYIVTYAATKAFDRVFAEGLWLELSPYGIDVTTVMPGAVDTPGFRETIPAGHEPTAAMQPADPRVVVERALEGLGTTINVHPSQPADAPPPMATIPITREEMLRMGDSAVREMYDR